MIVKLGSYFVVNVIGKDIACIIRAGDSLFTLNKIMEAFKQ